MPQLQQNTPDSTLDPFNDQLRVSDVWQNFMRRNGIDPARVRLSDGQRHALQQELQQAGLIDIGKGMEIDSAGNVNQKEGFGKYAKWAIPAAIGAGTLGFGLAGMGPLAGLFGGGGGGAAAAGGAAAGGELASSSIPASLAMHAVPGAIASQGVSASVPMLGGLAGAAGGGAGLASAAGAGAGSALANGSGLLGKILGAAPAIASGIGAVHNLTQGPPQAQKDLERILGLAENRVNQTEPLFQALNAMAQSRLPDYVKQGR